MEASYRKFKSEVEKKVLSIANIALILLVGWNLILGLIGTRTYILYRSLLLGLCVAGAIIKIKWPRISRCIILIASILSLYVALVIFKVLSKAHVPESFFMIGNYNGIIEVIIIMAVRDVKLQIATTLANLALKLGMLSYGLRYTTITIEVITTFGLLLFLTYYETVERSNYRLIYESREQLKKFKSLLSNDFPSSVLIMSLDFSSVLYSNHFFQDKFGSNEEKDFTTAIFRKFQVESYSSLFRSNSFFNQSLQDFVKEVSCKTMILQEKEVITLLAAFTSNDNSILHYEIKLRQISWDLKPSYALIFNDVSDKQLVMALKIADQHKDRIIATVSHELRTPINGILGLLEIISSRVVDQVNQTYLGYCKSCSRLLLYLVNAILDLSQVQNNRLKIVKTSFNLNTFLEELKSLYLFQAQQKNIEFIINRKPNIPDEIYTDKYRLIEILINLLGNAFKFTLKGRISLTVSRVSDNENAIAFSVSDTGVGIRNEDKSKLFTMFGKLNQEDKNINAHGVGLGLTIANELVKALNDDKDENLKFESKHGQGSNFYFRIPVEKELKLAKTALETENSLLGNSVIDEDKSPTFSQNKIQRLSHAYPEIMISQNLNGTREQEGTEFLAAKTARNKEHIEEEYKKNILIVDDNPFNLLAASFLLEKLNFKVTKAMSGEECLQLLNQGQRNNLHYNLVLMDIQMPVMDGIETCKIIKDLICKQSLSDIPIVALSANDHKKDTARYIQSGFAGYLEKPLKEEDLVDILSKCV